MLKPICIRTSSILFLSVIAISAKAANWEPVLNSSIELHSQPITITGASDDWKQGEYFGGTSQYGSIQAQIGIRNKASRTIFSTLYRQDYGANFSRDTADYYYQTKQDQLQPNRNYDLDLSTYSFKAKGLALSHEWRPNPQWSIKWGGQVFGASNLQQAALKGSVQTQTNPDDQKYQAAIRYYYDKDHLLDRPNVQTPDGLGYALNTQIRWENAKFQVDMDIQDIFGCIQWDHVPYTDAVINSNISIIGSDGFNKVKGRLSGTEGYLDTLTTKLDPKIQGQLTYKANGIVKPLVAFKTLPDETLVGFGARMGSVRRSATMILWPKQQLFDVSLKHGKWAVGLSTDKWNSSRRRAWASLQYAP